MAQGFVYPARNLPGLAENWGRAVESRIRNAESVVTQVSQTVDNGLRVNAGQLAVMSRQIDQLSEQVTELSSRSTSSTAIPTLSVSGTATIEPFPRNSVAFTLPGTNVSRSARIDIQGLVTEAPGGVQALMWLRTTVSGVTTWASERGLSPSYASAPSEWGSGGGFRVTGGFDLVVPAGPSVTVTMHAVRTAFTGTSSTLSFVNGLATITYGAPA